MMQLDFAKADFIGARSQQQDTAASERLVSGKGALFVLADGLGGHESGAEASQIVVGTFKEVAAGGAFDQVTAWRDNLRETLDIANRRIADSADPGHGQRGMASTAVAVVVADGLVQWVSVGDSHLYIWRGGRLAKLNEDHSQAGLMVRSGQYKATDPEVLGARSVLVSALTGRKLELVDHPAKPFALQAGDVLLLASDGLNTLDDAEVARIIGETEPQGALRLCGALLEAVRSRRMERQDNTTVVVARVLQLRPQQAADPVTEVTTPPPPPPRLPPPVIATQTDISTAPVTARRVDDLGPVPAEQAPAADPEGGVVVKEVEEAEAEPEDIEATGRRSLIAPVLVIVLILLCVVAALLVVMPDLINVGWRSGSPAGQVAPATTNAGQASPSATGTQGAASSPSANAPTVVTPAAAPANVEPQRAAAPGRQGQRASQPSNAQPAVVLPPLTQPAPVAPAQPPAGTR